MLKGGKVVSFVPAIPLVIITAPWPTITYSIGWWLSDSAQNFIRRPSDDLVSAFIFNILEILRYCCHHFVSNDTIYILKFNCIFWGVKGTEKLSTILNSKPPNFKYHCNRDGFWECLKFLYGLGTKYIFKIIKRICFVSLY